MNTSKNYLYICWKIFLFGTVAGPPCLLTAFDETARNQHKPFLFKLVFEITPSISLFVWYI